MSTQPQWFRNGTGISRKGTRYGGIEAYELTLGTEHAPNTVVAWSRRKGTSYPITPVVHGTLKCGNERQDRLNSKYIIMGGWNPAEARDGTNSDWFIPQARERGARIVCVDPRHTMSAVSLADEWIPFRPGTHTAMMSAMAWVILTEELTRYLNLEVLHEAAP